MSHQDQPAPDQPKPAAGSTIVFYDGVCGLCNRSVQWVLRRDGRGIFQFAHLGSAEAKRSIPTELINTGTPSTLILRTSEACFIKSDAWLKIIGLLGAPWSYLAVFKVIPRPIRDFIYDHIAKRRYRWFGRFESCPMPEPKFKDRFLD
jgi:predicted DCC family thiol-disulfide oxidoreductase YuxK